VPALVTPSRGQPIARARRAPQTWVECGPTPSAASRRESAEPVCQPSTRSILSVGVPAEETPVVCATELTRFTPAVNGRILSLNQDSGTSAEAHPFRGGRKRVRSERQSTDPAEREYEKRQPHEQERIVSKLDEIVTDQWREPSDYLDLLTGAPHSKLRIGAFRLGCTAVQADQILWVYTMRSV